MGVGAVDDLVMRAGTLISAEEDGRRALVLRKLGRPGESSTSRIQVGLELIPCSKSRRHTQSTLRFILEGSDAWTATAICASNGRA
jgi:gentisate 1,2-dioxygenase